MGYMHHCSAVSLKVEVFGQEILNSYMARSYYSASTPVAVQLVFENFKRKMAAKKVAQQK